MRVGGALSPGSDKLFGDEGRRPGDNGVFWKATCSHDVEIILQLVTIFHPYHSFIPRCCKVLSTPVTYHLPRRPCQFTGPGRRR